MTQDEEWLLMILAAAEDEPVSIDSLIQDTGWDEKYLLECLDKLQEKGYVDNAAVVKAQI